MTLIERNKRIEDRWKEGFSGGMIAIEEGMTRNAVMGVIHRAGLRRRPDRPVTIRKSFGRIVPIRKPPPEPTPLEPAPEGGVNLLDLTFWHCRWPLDVRGENGLRMFCGARKADATQTYCTEHRIKSRPLPR